jgi:hypothetical protein
VSRFCVFWIRNTIRKVTIVVPVLMTSCQLSLQPNTGPSSAQRTTVATALEKPSGWPAQPATCRASRLKPPVRCEPIDAVFSRILSARPSMSALLVDRI